MIKSRARRVILPVGLLLLVFLFIHACVPRAIADLRVERVRRVPAAALPLSDSLRDTMRARGVSLLKITLAGSAHWVDEVQQHELNGYPKVARCDEPDRELFAFGPFVGAIPISYYGDGLSDFRPASATLLYDIYLPATGRYRSAADFNARMPSYDLDRERMTLCIRIVGGAMHGAYGRSNEARIDAGHDVS